MLRRFESRVWLIVLAPIAASVLAGCHPLTIGAQASDTALHRGRYVGVGIYSPAQSWTKMVLAQQSGSPSAARPRDDEAIIVVTDSDTGELRACGDMSGYCVGMNPWSSPLATSQAAPVSLTQHADEPVVAPRPMHRARTHAEDTDTTG